MTIEIREPGVIRPQLEADINAGADSMDSSADVSADLATVRPQLAEDIGEIASSVTEIEQELR